MFGGSSARAGKSGPEGDLRELIESSNDLLWSVDLQFNILTFNRAFAVLVAGVTGTRAEAGMCAEPLWRERYERALQGGPYRTLHTFSEGSVYELAFWPLGGTGVGAGENEGCNDVDDGNSEDDVDHADADKHEDDDDVDGD